MESSILLLISSLATCYGLPRRPVIQRRQDPTCSPASNEEVTCVEDAVGDPAPLDGPYVYEAEGELLLHITESPGVSPQLKVIAVFHKN